MCLIRYKEDAEKTKELRKEGGFITCYKTVVIKNKILKSSARRDTITLGQWYVSNRTSKVLSGNEKIGNYSRYCGSIDYGIHVYLEKPYAVYNNIVIECIGLIDDLVSVGRQGEQAVFMKILPVRVLKKNG